jgi:hypothetical protein
MKLNTFEETNYFDINTSYNKEENNNISNFNESFNFYDILLFIKNNFIQILLLLSVFFIIYIIDYITLINSNLYGLPSPIPTITNNIISNNLNNSNKYEHNTKIIKNKNKKK